MFSKIVAFIVVASLAVFVAAAPTTGGGIQGSCNTGDSYCCNDMHNVQKGEVNVLKALYNVDVPVDSNVGVTCSPLFGGNSCSKQPVCCSGNNFSGAVVLGCTPINVNL